MKNSISVRLGTYKKVDCVSELNSVINYFDLTFLISGKLHYLINGEEITLKSGDAILIFPNSHRKRKAENQPARYFSFNFYAVEEDMADFSIYMPDCLTALIKEHLTLFGKMKEDGLGRFHEEKQNLVLQLILILLKEEMERKHCNPHVNHIIQYVRNHYAEKITLQDIADSVYLSVPYCCNLVKKELGITIYDMILRERILLAQEYIIGGEKKLREIPELCGFQDYGHFSKYFKKFTGELPSRYMKR